MPHAEGSSPEMVLFDRSSPLRLWSPSQEDGKLPVRLLPPRERYCRLLSCDMAEGRIPEMELPSSTMFATEPSALQTDESVGSSPTSPWLSKSMVVTSPLASHVMPVQEHGSVLMDQFSSSVVSIEARSSSNASFCVNAKTGAAKCGKEGGCALGVVGASLLTSCSG